MSDLLAKKGNFVTLLPLLFFVICFLGAGIYLGDFYALPAPIAVIPGIVLAFLLYKGSVESKVSTLLKGCGDDKIITMCLIYLLAGAFTVVCKATGSVDAIVNFGLNYISIEFLYAGVFLISAFLSLSTGTSVGAIVALAAIVMSFADKTGASLAVLSASLLGGAMFGDNLSFISDTTIAATQSLEIKMKDKFKQNFKIALPAALVTIVVLLFKGVQLEETMNFNSTAEVEIIRIIPYLLVIGLAVTGINVFAVLLSGIITGGAIGLWQGNFDILGLAKLSYEGFTGMTEIFLLSMLIGGLAAMVTKAGGLDYISGSINQRINKKSGYFGIGGLVGLSNLAIANNTVSILVTGSIAKDLSNKFKLNKVTVASVLDIFACITQGVLPYGAQVLLILSYAEGKIHYFDLIANTWYLWLLLAGTVFYLKLKSKNKLQETSITGELLSPATE